MKHRFRFLGERLKGGQWQINPEDAFHMHKVLRLGPGSEIELADGLGSWCIGEISSLSQSSGIVTIKEEFFEDRPSAPLTLALACMRPSSFEELLPSLIELGVDKIAIFSQLHTDRKWLSEKVQARWQRIVAAAMKQCKRSYRPQLTVYNRLEEVLGDTEDQPSNRFFLEPGAEQSLLTAPMLHAPSLLVIGSEKGLSPEEEVILARENFLAVQLGKNILRAYTACLAATTVASLKRDQFS